ncbi:MAG: 5-formyltetrahydrofolate cyclo-ligase, partial [Muribaculaceae bacterium]|nr:5-formyltetrahydrofolate cyclo-ligase [Muribaculaceae bacterium]
DMDSKSRLRVEMKEVKRSLTPEYKAMASARIFDVVGQMPEFAEASKVMIYHSLPDEVITHEIIDEWARSKTIYLPIVQGDDIVVAKYSDSCKMKIGDFGILEPSNELIIPKEELSDIDMCIIPAVALSRKGERLGRGKGYYDRFLSGMSLTKIGVCYKEQLVDEIPTEPTDILMNFVVTDEEFIQV